MMTAAKVLIVEDEAILAENIRDTLCRMGYDVPAIAMSGEEAVRLADAEQPDLVLMDIKLKGEMDGIEAAGRIRDQHGLPVIYLTAYSEDDFIERAKNTAAFGFLIKPFQERELKSAIEIALYKHRMERKLQDSERRYRFLFDSMLYGFALHEIICDEQDSPVDYRFLEVNTAFEDIIGKTLLETLPESEPDWIEKYGQCALQGTPLHFEYHAPTPGKYFEVHAYSPAAGQFATLFIDITEHRLMEKALMKSQKMAEIGKVTAGVAHEINSPLQVITGVSESLIRQLKREDIDTPSMIGQLEMVNRNGWRLAGITRSLLNFARASDSEIEPHDLNEVITDTLLLIEHQMSTWSNITIKTDLARNLPEFSCSRNRITQVLINLLSNARDAMPDGGTIDIKTVHDEAQAQLLLLVADSGAGMPDDVRTRIFTPFFTTKPPEQGTGLGLSITADIIREHNGSIDVTSVPGKGSEFVIRFPVGGTAGNPDTAR